MIDLNGVVTFRDGTTLAVSAHQGEYAAWERYALRKGYPMHQPTLDNPGASATMVRYLGYAACHQGRPQSEWESFDVWDAGVVDVTLEGDEAASVPPTLKAASEGWSPP